MMPRFPAEDMVRSLCMDEEDWNDGICRQMGKTEGGQEVISISEALRRREMWLMRMNGSLLADIT